ncbi:MAG: hypothetical protein J6K48_12190 [Lachnospiraceae bacterium]|nr:hypothetical protein [Lachnospiraceae bacterium]
MSRSRKKKKGTGTIVFLCVVIVICVVVLAGLVKGTLGDGIKNVVVEKATEQIMEQAVQKALENAGDPQAAAKAKEIVNNMDESDKQQAEEIIEKYADTDTLSDCMDIVSGGVTDESIAEVKDYLQESVSAEDMQKLQELYEKYGGVQ